MKSKTNYIEKGKLILFNADSYDDLHNVGLYRCKKDFDIDKLKEDYILRNKNYREYGSDIWGNASEKNSFICHLVKWGLIEKEECLDIHLGCHGDLDLSIDNLNEDEVLW